MTLTRKKHIGEDTAPYGAFNFNETTPRIFCPTLSPGGSRHFNELPRWIPARRRREAWKPGASPLQADAAPGVILTR